jgi:AcrR family transcriptional regulator
MPGGGPGSVSKRGNTASDARRPLPAPGSRAVIAPIYKRLPHGPHRLERDEVVRHQRARIYGAMIEAVALSGYERTSVRQVIGLAGVSRRSFYEQFTNKQECFLSTFDLLAGHGIRSVAHGYLSAEGDFGGGLRGGLRALCSKIEQAPKAASLVLVDAQAAGTAGALRVHSSVTRCERLLAGAFAQSPDATRPPAPVVRAIAGGLHGALAHEARTGGTSADAEGVAERMTAWALPFDVDWTDSEELLATRLRARMRQISLSSAHREGGRPSHEDERARILHEALRLASLYDYRELSAPQIADEARVPIDSFLELFATREECYLAALGMIGERLLEILAQAGHAGSEWPDAVRLRMAGLLGCLGEQPLYARTIAQSAFAAGSDPASHALALLDAIAAELSRGAPEPRAGLVRQAIAGALLHTIRTQVLAGRVQLLGALSEHLSLVVLASHLGADAAHEALSRPAPAAC